MGHREPLPVEAACAPADASGATGLPPPHAAHAARADRRACAAHGLLTSRSMARKTRRSLRGSALVEVGIIILPLVTISFAVLDFAGILYTFLAMENGVREETRFDGTGTPRHD